MCEFCSLHRVFHEHGDGHGSHTSGYGGYGTGNFLGCLKIGWRKRPGARVTYERREYRVDVQINSLGERDVERRLEKPPGTFRVLALGDSFIEAYTVALEDSVTRRLEGSLSHPGCPIEVLNGTRTMASTEIGGLTVEECGSIQCAYLDPSAFSSLDVDPLADPTVVSVVPDPASGWGRITLQARETGFSDMGNGTLTETVTDVMLESLPLRPVTFSGATGGNLEITYALNLSWYPVLATVDATVWENVTATDYPRFLQAAH